MPDRLSRCRSQRGLSAQYRHDRFRYDGWSHNRFGADPETHRLPSGSGCWRSALDQVEAELRNIEIDDPGQDRRPFLEVAVRLDGAEPELRSRIEAALDGKPVRLTRIIRQTEGQGGTLADNVEGDTELDALEPAHVFARRHVEEYGIAPAAELTKALTKC